MDVGGDEAAFHEEKMSSVVLFQNACLNKQEVFAVLNSVHDVPENLDFDLPASFGCERATERYSVPVLPLPPAESEQRSFDFII